MLAQSLENSGCFFVCLFLLLFCCLSFGIPCHFFLIARSDVLGKRNCCVQPFSNAVVRVGGREGKHSRVLKLGRRETVLLEYKLTRVSQPFFLPLLGEQGQRWVSPFPTSRRL